MTAMVELPIVAPVGISAVGGALILGLVLIALIVLLGVGVLWLRRMLLSRREGRQTPILSLEALEKLRGAGRISDEEFKRLRNATLGLDEPAGGNDNCALSAAAQQDDDESGAAEG